MIFIFGSRMMGKVDEVPGMFHVATKFFHVDFLPLIPSESYIVLSQQGGQFRGVRIPLSWRSVVFAWGRVLSVIGCLTGAIWGLIDFGGTASLWPALAILSAASAGIFYMLMWHKPMLQASFNRANELAGILGLNARAFEKIQEIYGESTGRGFDVVPSATTPPPAEPDEGPPAPR